MNRTGKSRRDSRLYVIEQWEEGNDGLVKAMTMTADKSNETNAGCGHGQKTTVRDWKEGGELAEAFVLGSKSGGGLATSRRFMIRSPESDPRRKVQPVTQPGQGPKRVTLAAAFGQSVPNRVKDRLLNSSINLKIIHFLLFFLRSCEKYRVVVYKYHEEMDGLASRIWGNPDTLG